MRRKLILICVSLFYALMLVNVGANFYAGWADSERGWEAGRVGGKPTIHTVDAEGPASVLRVGDEIIVVPESLRCAAWDRIQIDSSP
jgi:hypothetical protein